MSSATQGRAREYRTRDDLEARGYPFIMRAAASKGAADLLHGNPIVGAVLVQVGTSMKRLTCRLGAHDHTEVGAEQCGRNRFCMAADLCHALPVLAQVIAERGKSTLIRYWLVNRDEPRFWTEWTP